MTMPAGIQTVTLTGRYINPNGDPVQGNVTFTAPAVVQLADADTIALGSTTVTLDQAGQFSVALVATDNPAMQPTDWAYNVSEQLIGVQVRGYSIALPSSPATVDLADIAPADPTQGNYVLVPGPTGPSGLDGNTILSGSGTPTAGVGIDGDYWMDTANPNARTLYGPKTGGVWPATGMALGGGLIESVNGQTGPAVVLSAADVGADPAGSADSAQSAAATDATNKVTAHANAYTNVHGVATARKTTDEAVTNSITVQDDDQLSLPVAANSVYLVEGFLIYDGDTNGDFRLTFAGPTGATMDWTPNGLAGSQSFGVGSVKSLRQPIGFEETLGASGAGSKAVALPQGVLVTSGTAGSLVLRWAQAVASATPTTVFANSLLRLTRIG